MSAASLSEKLEHHRAHGLRLPKVVIPVHLAGQSCEMQAISRLARQYDFAVIEDASHAVGGSVNGEPVGSCRFSDITVFSFHPVKIITTGEGGMCLTRDRALRERMARLRTHGIIRDPDQFTREPQGPWYHEQVELGFNYRMTDLQAALGRSQLMRLDEFVARRNEIAHAYDVALEGLPLRRQVLPADTVSARHLYVVRVNRARHRMIFEALRSEGIGVNLHYMPVHLQPYYEALGFRRGMFPEAEAYGEEAITLPLFPSMADAQQRRVIDALRARLEP